MQLVNHYRTVLILQNYISVHLICTSKNNATNLFTASLYS